MVVLKVWDTALICWTLLHDSKNDFFGKDQLAAITRKTRVKTSWIHRLIIDVIIELEIVGLRFGQLLKREQGITIDVGLTRVMFLQTVV